MIRSDFVQRIVSNFEWLKYASPHEWALFRSMGDFGIFAEEIDEYETVFSAIDMGNDGKVSVIEIIQIFQE
jgi:Ca2+-binding EF-hand superfamily protein